jgi:FKBP-type peptidyl-prolyl cis-trans isomerase
MVEAPGGLCQNGASFPGALVPHDPRDGPPTLPPGVATVRTPTGLEVAEIARGAGPKAEAGRMVRVHYRAWLVEGQLVDDTEQRAGPVEFRIGEQETVAALQEGVEGMRVGGRRRLIAPSDLAWGSEGHGSAVPPYATLIFDVELVSVR